MPSFFPYSLTTLFQFAVFSKEFVRLSLLSICLFLVSCGKVYFPIELKTISRSDRSEKQEEIKVLIVPMTSRSIRVANRTPYERQIVEAGDLKKPANFVSAEQAIKENYPSINDPGPYLIGVADLLGYEELIGVSGNEQARITRTLLVNEDGFINFFQLGRIRAEGKTIPELEDLIYTKVVETGGNVNFNLFINDFRSKEIVVLVNGGTRKSFPYVSKPIYLDQIFDSIPVPKHLDARIVINRGDDKYVFSFKKIFSDTKRRFRLFPEDKIFVDLLNYRAEKVLLVGETGAQRSIPIDSILRPSLSDAIFSGAVLNNTTSDFSQIYVIRKKKSIFSAYHLDITDPARVSLANQFEMRPDDIVFVATQPLSLYSRTLSQILGSTGLTLQARDTVRTEFRN